MSLAWVNTSIVTGPQAMYQFKALLAGAGTNTSQGSAGGQGWTVTASSDGTTFNTAGSGIDYWQSGSSGAKGCANNNAWIAMKMALANGVNRQILIQRGTSNVSWRIGYSYSGGFTGAGNGAISATVAPTATDGQALIGTLFGVATGSPAFANFFATDSTYGLYCAADSAAPYGAWLATASGTQNVTALVIDPLITGTYPTADTDPYCILAISNNTNGLSSATLGSAAIISSSSIQAYLKKGLAGEGFVQMGLGQFMINAAAIGNRDAILGPNAADGNDVLLPMYYGRAASLSAPTGGKGMSSMMQCCVNTRALKDTNSVASAGAKDYLILNDIAFQWNGQVPALSMADFSADIVLGTVKVAAVSVQADPPPGSGSSGAAASTGPRSTLPPSRKSSRRLWRSPTAARTIVSMRPAIPK